MFYISNEDVLYKEIKYLFIMWSFHYVMVLVYFKISFIKLCDKLHINK